MERHPAEPAQLDSDVERMARTAWEGLALAGATVPLNPLDLDLRHLIQAELAGIDAAAFLRAAKPRSASPVAA